MLLIGRPNGAEGLGAQIEAAKRLLAPGGTIILAVCNRFGLKYFAGTQRDAVSATKRILRNFWQGAVLLSDAGLQTAVCHLFRSVSAEKRRFDGNAGAL